MLTATAMYCLAATIGGFIAGATVAYAAGRSAPVTPVEANLADAQLPPDDFGDLAVGQTLRLGSFREGDLFLKALNLGRILVTTRATSSIAANAIEAHRLVADHATKRELAQRSSSRG